MPTIQSLSKYFFIALLSGCSLTTTQEQGGSSANTTSRNITPISDQRAVEDFKREGIKIEYSWAGMGSKVTAIEVTGYAPMWGNSSSALESSYKVAELDAKRKLNDFINRESITSSTSVNIITRNLEKAQDRNSNNKSASVITADAEVESANSNSGVNNAIRQDALTIASTLQQNVSASSRGILGGLRMIDNGVVDGGKSVWVVFRWEEKLNNSVIDVRRSMMR